MPTAKLAPWQAVAINNPYDHFAFFGGVAAGKSCAGSHFVIKMITEHPEKTGFIGANTYDQLSQATLRELFYWLEHYNLDFVVDKMPPAHWKCKRALKKYSNTIHVRNPANETVSLIFARVLSDENPLRGIEFSWYWLDETRDTPERTHDVVLSRMRESEFIKGIITTTTNGEDWTFKRFCMGDPRVYGSMHVPTFKSVEYGIISEKYYQTLRQTYSPLLAQQELDALHVNILGGKAYYAASDVNRKRIAPWGDEVPDRNKPLIIGCDFNFNPSPCVWVVGQIGEGEFSEHIHWFHEIALSEASTVEMTYQLLNQFPGFFYRVFGDVSGGVGTTSNAGETDYQQISNILNQAGVPFSIDYFQEDSKQNPKVRSRVENMNARLKNAVGEIRMTYNPDNCPLLDGDFKMVGWKQNTQTGRGKLDSGGDPMRTHASDAAGYAVWKLFPPVFITEIVDPVPSQVRAEFGLLERRT
jgi:hypothetical protein